MHKWLQETKNRGRDSWRGIESGLKRREEKGKGEKMPPAAPDSSAGGAEWHFYEEKPQKAGRRTAPTSQQPGTHTHGLHHCTDCWCGCVHVCVFCKTGSRNALKNANSNHIPIACVCACSFLAFQSSLFTALNNLLSNQISNGQTHRHTHTHSVTNTPAWCC